MSLTTCADLPPWLRLCSWWKSELAESVTSRCINVSVTANKSITCWGWPHLRALLHYCQQRRVSRERALLICVPRTTFPCHLDICKVTPRFFHSVDSSRTEPPYRKVSEAAFSYQLRDMYSRKHTAFIKPRFAAFSLIHWMKTVGDISLWNVFIPLSACPSLRLPPQCNYPTCNKWC